MRPGSFVVSAARLNVIKRVPISLKILSIPVVITLMMLSLLLVLNVALKRQQDAFFGVVGGPLTISSATSRLLLSIAEVQSEVLRYAQMRQRVSAEDPLLVKLKGSILDRYSAAEEQFNTVKRSSGPSEADAVANISDFLTIHRAVSRRILESESINATAVSTLMAHYQQLQSYIVELATRSLESAQTAEARTRSYMEGFQRAVLVGSALAMTVAILLTLYVGRNISNPIARLVGLMRRIAAGETGVSVPETDRKDEIGDMAKAVEVFASVTKDLRDREQSLIESQALAESASQHKSQFLANMSHELRTPLNSVLGFTEMLSDGVYGELPERAKAALSKVENNGRHLLGLINDVLDLSKIEAGQLRLSASEYSLAQLLGDVIAGIEPQASAKGLKLTCRVEPDLPRGLGDERRLAQVLINLVGNAVKFTDSGCVDVAARLVGADFEVTVHDTGPGVAPDDQERIFSEFQQVDDSSTRRKGGTGLGLAISRRIVEMHGGRLTVQSSVGQGSTFRVQVPARIDARVEVPA
jgi:signal transduction histidine kinase